MRHLLARLTAALERGERLDLEHLVRPATWTDRQFPLAAHRPPHGSDAVRKTA
jgi:hypothetical protein